MKEICFTGPEMAYEHASFQIFKHTNLIVGMMFPNYEMLALGRKELHFNIESISKSSIYKFTERTIELQNGSSIFLMTQGQGSSAFRGLMFNIFFVMYQYIPYEMKLELIPCLATNPNNKLYIVSDGR